MVSRDPAYALQEGVYAALTTSPDVMALFAPAAPRVYDRVPAGPDGKVTAEFPYLTIGDDQLIGMTNQAIDPTEVFAKVEIWSRPKSGSKGEVKQLAGAVRTALCANIALAGHQVITNTFHGATYRREADGLTEHAILTIRYLTQPATAPDYLGDQDG